MTERPVIVLTNERDFAADEVIHRLDARGANVRRLNIEGARTRAVESWNPHQGLVESPPAVVWWRQFESDDHPQTTQELDDVLVERAQWRTWVATLAAPESNWVNDIWAARRAENKVEQLRAALHVGFDVPTTLVTNDSGEARGFRDRVGPCIVKTLTSAYFSFSDESFVFTEFLDDATLESDGWHRAPLIVQKQIAGGFDARVVSFGDRCYAAKCRTRDIDWRKAPFEEGRWQPWGFPIAIKRSCEAYRALLGLEYAAFDFMITSEGSVLFLEANQAGEWLFLDRSLELGIADAFVYRLIDLASHVGQPPQLWHSCRPE